MLIAIDTGFGRTKAMASNKKISIPSVIDNFRPISFSGISGRDRKKELCVGYRGKNYFIGDMAISQGSPVATLGADRFLDDEGMALMLTAMFLLCDGHGQDVSIVVGLPVTDYARLANQYRAIIRGDHEIKEISQKGNTVSNHRYHIKKTRIIPQPLGTVLSRVFDEDGEVISKSYMKKTIGVIDIGYYTLDLAVISNMQFIDRNSASYNHTGIHSILSEVSSDIYNKHGKQMSPEVMEDALRTGYTKVKGRAMSISDITEEAYKRYAETVASMVKNKWKNIDDIDTIVLTGGGSRLFGNGVAELIDHDNIEISDHGIYTNVCGYYRYALATYVKKKKIG